MHLEKEIKVLDINPNGTVKRLMELGAKFVFSGTMREIAFDHPRLRLKERDVLLRLRQCRNPRSIRPAELTLKKKTKGGSKLLERIEIETEVSDFEATREILEALGFRICRDREKAREEWMLGDIKAEVDSYPDAPPYIELEGSSRKKIKKAIQALGLSDNPTSTMSSTELLKHWGIKNYNFIKF